MSDAGAPDAEAYGELLKLLGLPGAVSDSVDTVWDAINTSHTGTGQVESGLEHMANRYDADDDMAAFMLRPSVPVLSAPSSGGGHGGGGGASIQQAPFAAVPDERSALAGAGILDSGSSVISNLCEGNWVDAALSGVSTVLDAAATAADPLGSLLAAGIGWAIDHLNPIKDWFDDVTGNPESVSAKAESWDNIAQGLDSLPQTWRHSLNSLSWMTGDAISSYKAQADVRITTLRRLKGSSDGAAAAMDRVAFIVTFVHNFLRDVLASLVGAILSWVAETVLSLGTLIPWVISQIGTRIASVVGKCSRYITGLTRSGTQLASLLRSLKGFGDDILRLLNRITPNPNLYTPRHAGAPGAPVPVGPWRPPDGWTPPRGQHANTPWDNLADIPPNLPWRDGAVNSTNESVKNATPDPEED
ncbi:hypothetical protein ACOCJ5_14870 [Knoellia sp. CPCC 206450]|uniref:hypothetical protein n=1 Tax=Knoellia tibetensis TaxID=3404798 RepID=UPI003B43BD6E